MEEDEEELEKVAAIAVMSHEVLPGLALYDAIMRRHKKVKKKM